MKGSRSAVRPPSTALSTPENPTVTAMRFGQDAKAAGGSPVVGIVMGSRSDWATMHRAAEVLEQFGVRHRTPGKLASYAQSAADRGLKVIIAGAGGAAHLPGMMAAQTHLPVLGVPVESAVLRGVDSLLSIVQMPAGIPVGTLAIGTAGAANAALLAVGILALGDEALRERLIAYRAEQTARVLREGLETQTAEWSDRTSEK
jgi:5-(carboxyamino)imidazole ribonucleotide mutase